MEYDESAVYVEALEQSAPDDMETLAYLGESGAAPCPDVYVVQPGDTYFGIAAKLGITATTLTELNPAVDPNALQIGQYLCIPLQGPETGSGSMPMPGMLPPVAPTPYAAQDLSPQQTAPQDCPANHTSIVVPYQWDFGNVLLQYGISYDALARANPSVAMDTIYGGETLYIPPYGSRGLCAGDGFSTYVIERTDTLESLSRQFHMSTAYLLRANPNLAPQDFSAGRVICIPE